MDEATVREWSDEEGWGVLDSPQTPGGCWASFAHVEMAGWRTLTPAQRVHFTYEPADQDGFAYRAVRVLPSGGVEVPIVVFEPGGGYASSLTLDFDDDGPAG